MSWILLYIQNTEALMKNSSIRIALDDLALVNLILFNFQTKRQTRKLNGFLHSSFGHFCSFCWSDNIAGNETAIWHQTRIPEI